MEKIILKQSYDFKLDKEMFERAFLGIWPKQNPTIRKKGNKMIESLNLIDLYERKQGMKIEKEYNEKIDKIRTQLSLENKMSDIIVNAEEELRELYFSQFTQEQKENFEKGKIIDQSGFSLICREQIRLTPDGSIYVNGMIENDEIHNFYKEMQMKIEDLRDRTSIIRAHVGIAKTKEEVEEILTNYGILKKGKLVI